MSKKFNIGEEGEIDENNGENQGGIKLDGDQQQQAQKKGGCCGGGNAKNSENKEN